MISLKVKRIQTTRNTWEDTKIGSEGGISEDGTCDREEGVNFN